MSKKTPLGVKPGPRASASKIKTPPVQSSPSPTAKPNAWGKPLSFKQPAAAVEKVPVTPPVGGKANEAPVEDGSSGEETLVWACKTMTGMNVSIETKDGKVYKGILKNTQTMKNGKLNRFFAVHVVDTGAIVQVQLNEFKQLTVERLDMTFAEEGADSFRTDSQISGMGWNERELTKWQGEEGMSLEDDTSLHGGQDWDQFAENHKRFGIRADFNETLYTTALNPNEFDRSEHSKAERLAREIMKGDTTNVHMREERGIQPGTDYDEEELYGAVMRDQGDGRYVPPHLRNAAANNTQPTNHSQANSHTQQSQTQPQSQTQTQTQPSTGGGATEGAGAKDDSDSTVTKNTDKQEQNNQTAAQTPNTNEQSKQTPSTTEAAQSTTDTAHTADTTTTTTTTPTSGTKNAGAEDDSKSAPENSEKGAEIAPNTTATGTTPSTSSPSVMSDPAILSGNKSKLRPTAKAFNPSAKAFVPGGGSRSGSVPQAPAVNGAPVAGMPMSAAEYKQQLIIQQILFQQAQQQMKQAQMGFSPGQNFYPNGAGRGMVPYFAGPGGVPMPVPAGYQMPGSGSAGPTQMDYNAYLAAMAQAQAQQRMSPSMVPMQFDPSGTPSPRAGSPLPHNTQQPPPPQPLPNTQQPQGSSPSQAEAMSLHAQGQAHAFAQAQAQAHAQAQAQAQLMRQHGGRVGPFSPHNQMQGQPNMQQPPQHAMTGHSQSPHPGQQGQGHNRPKSSHSHGRRSNASSNTASPSPQPPHTQHSGKKWNNNKGQRTPATDQGSQN